MRVRQMNVKIGVCSVNNDPLDFTNNYQRIIRSVQICKDTGCSIRIGAEMEIPGYGCNDHFMEYDTTLHSWDVIRDILASNVTNGIVCEFGCPVLHKSALYNCRVIIYNSKIVAVRVKMILADGGNYFETRYFTNWKDSRAVGEFMLPRCVQQITGQYSVPIGVFILSFNDTSMAYEICEESWISNNPMIDAALDGAEIFVNPSASEIERGKLKRKLQMIQEFTERHGGAYAYVNLKGAIGDRNYFDGCCMFSQNGKIKELSEPFDLEDVSVTSFICNITSIRTFRLSNKSFQKESHGISKIPRVKVDVNVATCSDQYIYDNLDHKKQLARKRVIYDCPHATFEPSAYLWDILRKSKARGFFLPLSGGVDSCCVSMIVYNMCHMVYQEISKGKKTVLSDLRKLLRDTGYNPTNAQEMCHRILYTCYMATENSSQNTRLKARQVAQTIGSTHREINFDEIYHQYQTLGKAQLGFEAKFKKEGGSWRTDLALQNVQARTRMVLSYFFSLMELQNQKLQGFLLVLGSSNLDESLRGYFTKYDCSSADYNPIGSFSKSRVRQILKWTEELHGFKVISEVMDQTPSAELRPLKEGEIAQTDEEDMQLTYDELNLFGRLRKVERLGPVSMFDRVYAKGKYPEVQVIADKIKKFFMFYGMNRHKCTTLTPSFHFDPQGCDDNRFDMRPLLYATNWDYQFEIIDQRVKEIHAKSLKSL